jgi:hypothetical protein
VIGSHRVCTEQFQLWAGLGKAMTLAPLWLLGSALLAITLAAHGLRKKSLSSSGTARSFSSPVRAHSRSDPSPTRMPCAAPRCNCRRTGRVRTHGLRRALRRPPHRVLSHRFQGESLPAIEAVSVHGFAHVHCSTLPMSHANNTCACPLRASPLDGIATQACCCLNKDRKMCHRA